MLFQVDFFNLCKQNETFYLFDLSPSTHVSDLEGRRDDWLVRLTSLFKNFNENR